MGAFSIVFVKDRRQRRDLAFIVSCIGGAVALGFWIFEAWLAMQANHDNTDCWKPGCVTLDDYEPWCIVQCVNNTCYNDTDLVTCP